MIVTCEHENRGLVVEQQLCEEEEKSDKAAGRGCGKDFGKVKGARSSASAGAGRDARSSIRKRR